MSHDFEHEALVEDESIGMTSDETEAASTELESDEGDPSDKSKTALIREMTIYDSMLLVSFICVTLATVLMFFSLAQYGSITSGFPWRTSEVLVK